MIRTIEQRGLHIDHRVPEHDAILQRLLDPFADRRDVFPWDHTADDLVHKFETGTRLPRLQPHQHVTVLTPAA